MIESYQQHNTHFQKLILGKIDSNDAYNSQILNLLNDYLIKGLDPQQQKAIEKSFKKEII